MILYLDGQALQSAPVPAMLHTAARACALGGNPNYPGNEFLAVDIANFVLYYKALTQAEVETCRLAKEK